MIILKLFGRDLRPKFANFFHDMKSFDAWKVLSHLRPYFLDKQHVRSQRFLGWLNFSFRTRRNLLQLSLESDLVLLGKLLVPLLLRFGQVLPLSGYDSNDIRDLELVLPIGGHLSTNIIAKQHVG